MRGAAGCINHVGPYLALLALAACRSAAHPPAPRGIAAEPCTLHAIEARAVDSAVIAFDAPVTSANECVLQLAAAALRPWHSRVLDPWTITVTAVSAANPSVPTATVRRMGPAQARDALDAESVLVATDDLELVEYATARDDLTVVALPWDRLYLRVGAPPGDSLGVVDPAAVRAAAREAAPLPDCDAHASLTPRETSISSRAIYLIGDRTARELAERIVGMGNARQVLGLDSAAFEAALAAGADEAYVVSIPRSDDGCQALRGLLRRAPWADAASVMPLLETRAYAITRRKGAP